MNRYVILNKCLKKCNIISVFWHYNPFQSLRNRYLYWGDQPDKWIKETEECTCICLIWCVIFSMYDVKCMIILCRTSTGKEQIMWSQKPVKNKNKEVGSFWFFVVISTQDPMTILCIGMALTVGVYIHSFSSFLVIAINQQWKSVVSFFTLFSRRRAKVSFT